MILVPHSCTRSYNSLLENEKQEFEMMLVNDSKYQNLTTSISKLTNQKSAMLCAVNMQYVQYFETKLTEFVQMCLRRDQEKGVEVELPEEDVRELAIRIIMDNILYDIQCQNSQVILPILDKNKHKIVMPERDNLFCLAKKLYEGFAKLYGKFIKNKGEIVTDKYDDIANEFEKMLHQKAEKIYNKHLQVNGTKMR